MASRALPLGLLLVVASALVAASPAAVPAPAPIAEAEPMVTPSLVRYDPTKTYKNRRDILSDLAGDVNSVLSVLGSDVPSYVASGAFKVKSCRYAQFPQMQVGMC